MNVYLFKYIFNFSTDFKEHISGTKKNDKSAPQGIFHKGCGEVEWQRRKYGAKSEQNVQNTIAIIKFKKLRSFQRKVLCDSSLRAKSTTFVRDNKQQHV